MDHDQIKRGVALFLEGIGENCEREGLRSTPERVARMCDEIFSGMGQDAKAELVSLHEGYDGFILATNISFHSVCEHHLLPFMGKVHVAYTPQNGVITGISKIARMVDVVAKRLQLQERLTNQIADAIMEGLKPKGVVVVVEAEHLCMEMRGVKKQDSMVVTSVARGVFEKDIVARNEALSLIRGA